MIVYITWLRCLAAILITNAHYTGIYPADLVANGGLIGDNVFFCISGYCLTNLRVGFFEWYGKRLNRILPAVIIISAVYLILKQYDFSAYAAGTEKTLLYQALSAMGVTYSKWLSWFVYPTYYHFVASILVLYVPYYFILQNDNTRTHIPVVMGIILIAYVILYFFAYDKSYYHIDTVREPFIRFLFLESMLLGAWFKLNDAKLRNTGKPLLFAMGTAVVFAVYFASKILLAGGRGTSLQICNQILIFVLLFFITRWFSSMDRYLDKAPKWLFRIVTLIADLTLEIYLVQYVLIDFIREMNLFFPLNWIMLTTLIVVAAFILHTITKSVTNLVTAGVEKLQRKS